MGDCRLLLHTTYTLEKHDVYHREEANLKLYRDVWRSKPHVIGQFFRWLDCGPGRFVNLRSCPRVRLNRERVQYVPPGHRKPFRVLFMNGRLVYKATRRFVNTRNHADTIYVLSPKWKFYVADKVDKIFHHSSFLSGGDVLCAGHLHVNHGMLDSISYKSGHYKPTPANFELLKRFLRRHNVDLRRARMM